MRSFKKRPKWYVQINDDNLFPSFLPSVHNSIYNWGKELAELESTAMTNNDPRIQRWHHIVQMFGDAKITWRGGPKWWRLI